MTITGTHHFRCLRDARAYYARQGESAAEKLEAGEIALGPPPLKRGETKSVDEDGRYRVHHPNNLKGEKA